jgi:hypothetical protein
VGVTEARCNARKKSESRREVQLSMHGEAS